MDKELRYSTLHNGRLEYADWIPRRVLRPPLYK